MRGSLTLAPEKSLQKKQCPEDSQERPAQALKMEPPASSQAIVAILTVQHNFSQTGDANREALFRRLRAG